ncbi:Asp-tRNA(Asn)/Glu-tRNA(Gln) amidotransferase subunit GatC [Thiorhodospira sibirica]|uniref:Asp-tRNA(Asn)/Glu-tRNA(Gln) amidotransferase subunit GatC n=1 Tax=Thiorhodospira sibirica TaxID=154347 RepID=UPI00022C1146|nr:Asp-tRNA(Asn)/Glu-tRNA(Gln) amidotransferase subunit GatC [Thiorhodospira sibirica]
MSLNKDDVVKIAHLARLAIDEQSIPAYAQNLSDILAFVEQMDRVEVGGTLPMAHPLDMAQRLRADEVSESDQRALLQQGAPAVEAGLYLVPKVID